MGKAKKSNTKYTSATRIKNKTRKLEKRLETIKKEDSIEHIKRDCKIGRVKEGFKKEEFKFKTKSRRDK
jgi:hypothetical protein